MAYRYIDDIYSCNAYAQLAPYNMVRTINFVLATIQQQLETVPTIMADFADQGSSSKFAFGSKRHGLSYVRRNATSIFEEAADAVIRRNDVDLMLAFLKIPGLGLAKAGFASQLFANRVGCIDTHNLKLFESPVNLNMPKGLKLDTQVKHIKRYLGLCRDLGGSTKLWGRWCHFVYTLRPTNWANGGEVSRFHPETIMWEYDVDSRGILERFRAFDFQPKFLVKSI